MKLDSTWVRFSRSMPAWRLPISSWLHMTSFVMRTPNGLLPTISSAVSQRGVDAPSPSGTTRVTRPMRSASAASMRRPVSSSSNARDAPIRRGSSHDTPMSQPDRPMRTNATLKRAARGRDADVAREREREAAARRRAVHRRDDRLRHRRASSAPARRSTSARSCPACGAADAPASPAGSRPRSRSRPAQNPRPAPVSTITRQLRSLGSCVERVVQARDQRRGSSRSAARAG